MISKKVALILCLSIGLGVSLAGCGMSVGQTQPSGAVTGQASTSTKNSDSTDQKGIWQGNLATTLKQDQPEKVTLSVQNNKTQEVTLSFPTSQVFDYQIKDEKGTVDYTYSEGKVFAQHVWTKKLKPGEVYSVPIDLSEAMKLLANGSYTLEAWFATDNTEKLASSISIEKKADNANAPVMHLKIKQNGSFVGLADAHTVEIVVDGEPVDYQLSPTAAEQVTPYKKGDSVSFFSFQNDKGQKVIDHFEKKQ